MSIQPPEFHNSLTRQVEPLEPIASPTVDVYACGPTVYDHPHLVRMLRNSHPLDEVARNRR